VAIETNVVVFNSVGQVQIGQKSVGFATNLDFSIQIVLGETRPSVAETALVKLGQHF